MVTRLTAISPAIVPSLSEVDLAVEVIGLQARVAVLLHRVSVVTWHNNRQQSHVLLKGDSALSLVDGMLVHCKES